MEPERLEEQWRVRRASNQIELVMRFADKGLVLGVGTVLARAGVSSRDISIDVAEPRLLALLAAAHLRSPTSLGLAHLRKAAERWREKEDGLAAIHLALSQVGRLERPAEDARRLFLADSLLNAGLPPETILKVLDLDAPPEEQVSKYSPDQPRVPAGSGRASGQWTTGASGQSQSQTADGRTARDFRVDLPSEIICAAAPPPVGPFGQAVKQLGDAVEIADSVSKWRELGPKGEAAILAAVEARGWTLLATQVYVRTTLGLRVEDVMVEVPAGTAGNVAAYNGFIEVKVNGGRYSPLQQAKDALIGSEGGTLVTRAGPYAAGANIILETGLANVTITYEPE